jgi:hypothetical protein
MGLLAPSLPPSLAAGVVLKLASTCVPLKAAPGAVVLAEGDEGDMAYLLLSGALEARKRVNVGAGAGAGAGAGTEPGPQALGQGVGLQRRRDGQRGAAGTEGGASGGEASDTAGSGSEEDGDGDEGEAAVATKRAERAARERASAGGEHASVLWIARFVEAAIACAAPSASGQQPRGRGPPPPAHATLQRRWRGCAESARHAACAAKWRLAAAHSRHSHAQQQPTGGVPQQQLTGVAGLLGPAVVGTLQEERCTASCGTDRFQRSRASPLGT